MCAVTGERGVAVGVGLVLGVDVGYRVVTSQALGLSITGYLCVSPACTVSRGRVQHTFAMQRLPCCTSSQRVQPERSTSAIVRAAPKRSNMI